MKEIENLYMSYKEDVYSYLIYLTHDKTLSEDLLQETFIKSISSFNNFKGQSSIKTWLFSIARHLWLQHLRSEKPCLEYNDLLEIYISESIDEKIINQEIVSKIKKLIFEKDEKTQKIVNMRVEGFSYSEISNEVNISESSARVIDYRTKKWIKDILKKEGLF